MSQSPLHSQSLSWLCRQVKSGALASLDVTRSMLRRCEEHDGNYQSYARLLTDTALAEAQACDESRQNGAPLGVLHGVPIAIKDLLFTAGVETASGTDVMRDFKPDYDATVVTRLRAAGAVIIGKTQLTEGAYGSHHPSITAPVNPWAPDAWSGVSSSGSGVAVAAGLAYASLGSDTGGSIRFPSACNGLVGLKPTYGRVSLHGAFPLANSLDHIGPMTRSVEDAARMLQAIAGYDPQDPNSADMPVPSYLSYLQPSNKPVIVGIDETYISAGVPAAVTQVLADALARAGTKVEVRKVTMPPSYYQLAVDWGKSCAVECMRAHANMYPQQSHRYGPGLTWLLELGRTVSADEYAQLQNLRDRFRTELDGVLTEVDVLLAPTMPIAGPSVAQMEQGGLEPESAPFLSFTAPFDYSGHPTLNVPAGLDSDGLPQSVQLIGARFNESGLLAAGAMFERVLGPLDYPMP